MGNYGQGWVNYFSNLQKVGKESLVEQTKAIGTVASGIWGRNLGQVGQGVKDFVVGGAKLFKAQYIDFFKALFNHPGWYKYHGELHLPTVNAAIPFDSKSLKRLLATDVTGKILAPGISSGHVVHCYFQVADFRATNAWDLAMTEAFRINRLLLRSNLLYNVDTFSMYIYRSILVALKAKQVERTIGWYNIIRGDIPELQNAFSCVSANPQEQGCVKPTPIKMLQDANIAATLTQYDKLRSIIAMLELPAKLIEFVSYYAGSVFTDQSAANPNLYLPMIRDIPIYSGDDVVGTWNIESSDISVIIDEALDIINTFGIEAADIANTRMFGNIQLIPYGMYQPVVMEDPGFFTILINSYTMTQDQYANWNPSGSRNYRLTSRPDFLRCDILPEVNGEHTVVLANALGTYAGVPTVLQLMSQAIYLNVDSNFDVPSFKKTYTYASGGGNQNSEFVVVGDDAGAFVQFSTLVDTNNSIQQVAANTNYARPFSANERLAALSATETAGSVAVNVIANSIYSNQYAMIDEYFTYTAGGVTYKLYGLTSIGRTVYCIRVASGTTTFSSVDLVVADFQNNTFTVSGSIAFTGKLLPTSMGGITSEYLYLAVTNSAITSSTAGVITFFLNAYASGRSVLNNCLNGVVNITDTSISYKLRLTNTDLLAWFVDNVDYHMPIITKGLTNVVVSGQQANIYKPVALFKELYIPVLLNDIDIDNTLYWMYLGLFSVYDSAKPSDGRSSKGKRNGKGKRHGKAKPEEEKK